MPKNMAKKLINTIIKLGENVLATETGIVTSKSGYNASEIIVTKKADIVTVNGVARTTTGSFLQNTMNGVGVIPAGFRPKEYTYAGAATVGGNVGIIGINTAGEISFNHRTGRDDLTWCGFSVTYFI